MTDDKTTFYLEGELQAFQSTVETFPFRRKQLVAIQFYLQHIIWECTVNWLQEARQMTNYAVLLDQLLQWRHQSEQDVVLVTFNYDTFLEDVFRSQLGRAIGSMNHYVEDPGFALIKLHGSVNWGRLLVDAPAAVLDDRGREHILDQLDTIHPSAEYVLHHMPPPGYGGTFITHNDLLFPAIAIPVERKEQFECPEDHLAVLRDSVKRVEKVVTVGWRGTERHFLDLLGGFGGRNVPILIVSDTPEGAHQTETNLESAGLVGPKIRFTNDGFSGFVASDVLGRFLPLRPNLMGELQSEFN